MNAPLDSQQHVPALCLLHAYSVTFAPNFGNQRWLPCRACRSTPEVVPGANSRYYAKLISLVNTRLDVRKEVQKVQPIQHAIAFRRPLSASSSSSAFAFVGHVPHHLADPHRQRVDRGANDDDAANRDGRPGRSLLPPPPVVVHHLLLSVVVVVVLVWCCLRARCGAKPNRSGPSRSLNDTAGLFRKKAASSALWPFANRNTFAHKRGLPT